MKFVVDGTDLRGYANAPEDVETFGDTNLDAAIGQAVFTVEEDHTGAIAKTPKEGHEVLIYDDDDTTLLFGGFIRELEELQPAVVRGWRCVCDDWNVRAFETATGSLNKAGIVDSDRNFVIAIFKDALKAQTFGTGTGLDDAIIAANDPDWPGVQTTTTMSGHDWSYMSPADAMRLLLESVPSAFWRIRPDKVLEYGLFTEIAPFAVHTTPTISGLKPFERFRERVILREHRNKMRRGGAGAAEETAFDEVSYALYGKILDDPYKNDESVPSSELRRRTYAELRTKRARRTLSFTVRDKGLKAGQLIDVVNERVGAPTIPAPFVQLLSDAFISRSASGAIAGERGRFLIQSVRAVMEPGPQAYAFEVECGDAERPFAAGLAQLKAEVS